MKVTCLAGGVGAARFLQGLVRVVPPENVKVIVNTGDDIVLYGLEISPDIDIVTYTLAGIVDTEKGWGIQGDSFGFLEQMRKYGHETWFNLGDQDLATHINRTILLREGYSLLDVTRIHCQALGLKTCILPMTNDRVQTYIETNKGLIHFEEYLIKYRSSDTVLGVKFLGADTAEPAPGVIESIEEADVIIIAPSNPIVSIGTILSLKDVKATLMKTNAAIGGISPIIGGSPVKGPADKLMRGLGYEVCASSVALIYRDFLDHFVIDDVDKPIADKILKMGIDVTFTNTIMKTIDDKVNLAKTTLKSLTR
jgi:LPPG:FO 2-phospho-L-lactate transferase